MCFVMLPFDCIAEHADKCGDIWIGESSDAIVLHEINESDNSNPNTANSSTQEITTIQAVLASLQENTGKEAVLINIRRKALWKDFVNAKDKFKIMPNQPIRVVFLGEPAVDDGGPKREFFSGMHKLMCLSLGHHLKEIKQYFAIVNLCLLQAHLDPRK